MFFNQSKEIWWLVDCDSFFASCMIAKDPWLRGKIVCVWYDIIIARSHNAKHYGINIWTPVREAKKVLPKEAVILRPDFALYKTISARLMTYLRSKVEIVEQFSIDEAFFKVHSQDNYEQFALQLQQDIKKIIWIPVSIGIAPTRLVAKIFADYNKPFGTTVSTTIDQVNNILQTVLLKDIPFIWPKSQEKLSYHCKTAYDFSQLPYTFIKRVLGWAWIKIWLELRGVTSMNFTTKKYAGSISRTYSFNPHFSNEKNKVREHVVNNMERAMHQLAKIHMRTTHITVSFRTKTFHRFSFKHAVQKPIDERKMIIGIVRDLFEQAEFWTFLYRSTWVHFSGLVSWEIEQWSLFETVQKRTQKISLTKTIYDLNEKYWPWTITTW